MFMGFKEIYLLGVDHQYSQTIDNNGVLHINNKIHDYPIEMCDPRIESQPVIYLQLSATAYIVAQENARNFGVEIYNTTNGGALDVFKRVKLKDIIDQSSN
jgi:hypothetical protein